MQVTAVAARGDHVLDFVQIRRTYRDFQSLVADKEVDVIDICTPPALHASMIVEAVQAGKHVICEKPFTGYFGRGEDNIPIGKHVPAPQRRPALVGRLGRAQTFLRVLGIDIAFGGEGRGGSRIIRIGAIQQNTVSTVSTVRDHGRRVTTTLSATSP
jgi:hypothetical protein